MRLSCRVRAGFGLTLLVLWSQPVQGQAVCSPRDPAVEIPLSVSSIRLVAGVGSLPNGQTGTINHSALQAAASTWNAVCSSFLNPQLSTSGATSGLTVGVFFYPGRNDGVQVPECKDSCGCAKVRYTLEGQFRDATVFVFDKQANGTSCTSTMAGVLAHELGHVLGLADATSPTCSGAIMGSAHGAVSAADCEAVDRNFWTGLEGQDPGHEEGPCGT